MIQTSIKENDFETFKVRVEKLQKTAQKLHLDVPQYRVVGERIVPHPTIPHYMYKVLDLEIDDVNVTFDDWKVVCHIQRVSADLKIQGKVIGNAFYYPLEELPESCYEKSPTLCEHCGKNIPNRLLTFILRNEKTGEYKQVGSSCVKNFVSDNRNIASIIRFLEEYNGYMNCSHESDNYENMRVYVPTRDVIKICADILQKNGWVSRWDSAHTHQTPSIEVLMSRIIDYKWDVDSSVTDSLVDEIIEYSKKILLEMSEKESLTDNDNFMRNCALQVVNHSVEVETKCLQYALIGAQMYYHQYMRKDDKNQYYGEIGQEFTDRFIDERIKPFENSYGTNLLVMLRNHDGYAFKTFTNMNTKFAQFMLDRPINFAFESEFKIKAHEEYKGRKSTAIYFPKNFKVIEA